MDRTESPIDWLTEPARDERDATAKFKWWCLNHGVLRAYANVSIRERALIPLAVRTAIIEQHQHVNAPQPTANDITDIAIAWLDANPYREITTREMAENLEISMSQSRRIIRDLPHYFKRLNQYVWEIRNYRGEREMDKAR